MTERSYQVVLSGVEADLASGRLSVGGKLPGERALAERYGVSRPTVREAVRVLEALGVVRTATGSGPNAGATVTAEPAAPIGAALRWHLASRHLPVSDIVEARVLIESWAVTAAARAPDPAALAGAQAMLDRMDDPELSAGDFLALDAQFHVALADAAGNAVVAAVMSAMRTAIEAYVTAAVAAVRDWPAMVGQLRSEHHRIATAVLQGEAALASRLVADHITGFYRSTGVGASR